MKGNETTVKTNADVQDDLESWREQCRRQLQRSMRERMMFGFCRTIKPIVDDEPYRIFRSTQEYRDWCDKNLPKWLGYGKPSS